MAAIGEVEQLIVEIGKLFKDKDMAVVLAVLSSMFVSSTIHVSDGTLEDSHRLMDKAAKQMHRIVDQHFANPDQSQPH